MATLRALVRSPPNTGWFVALKVCCVGDSAMVGFATLTPPYSLLDENLRDPLSGTSVLSGGAVRLRAMGAGMA